MSREIAEKELVEIVGSVPRVPSGSRHALTALLVTRSRSDQERGPTEKLREELTVSLAREKALAALEDGREPPGARPAPAASRRRPLRRRPLHPSPTV